MTLWVNFMAGHIPEEIIEEIQNRCDIVDIINHYIPLKKAGANYKALCPFHSEKTPSFVVSPSKQIYHCFGCNAGGNVFGFIMQYEKLDFMNAVRLLAEKAGISIPEGRIYKEDKDSKGLMDINKFACELFQKFLFNPGFGKTACSYLKNRQIKEEIIRKFQLGYAPGSNELVKEAVKRGFSNELLLKAGLIVKSSDGFIDMFRNRLMFPIFNATGTVSGFSGRVLDNGLPKYINTPETPLFHKGKLLYGLNLSKSEIIKQDYVIICEGYFDFLRIYQEGVYNVAASQGTAFTADHLNLLSRYASSLIVSFDGDKAGDTASLRGLQMFLEAGMRVKVLQIPSGYDPDSFIKEIGIDGFRDLLRNAKDILETKLSRLCEENRINTTDGKLKVIEEILPDIVNMKNEIQKREFIKRVSARLSVPEESVLLELKKLRKTSQGRKIDNLQISPVIGKVISKHGEYPGEKQLVQVLLNDETISFNFDEKEIMDCMKNESYKKILEIVLKLKKTNRWKGPGSLIAYIKEEDLQKLIAQLCAEEISQGLDKNKIIRDCIYDVKKRHKEEMVKQLISRIKESEKNKGDVSGLIQEVNRVRKELVFLEKERQ